MIATITITLAACTSPTPYQAFYNGQGYADQKIEPNRYRVSFTGNSETPRETVENYLLYHAAEVTLREGKDYFVIAGRDTEARTYGEGPGVGGMFGQGIGPWGHSSWSGLSLSSGTKETEYSVHADIILHAGAKPADNSHAYDAREIVKNLSKLIARPTG